MRKKAWALIAATALVTTLFATAAAAGSRETADLFGQGMGGPVVGVASIRRGASSVTASVSMPTPVNYAVPPGATSSGELGSPAAFSLWVFIFFNPEECAAAICGPADLANPDVVGAGYNAGGHLVSGPHLTISGIANPQSQPFGPGTLETIGQALDLGYNIADAEIHVAVAPHGKLDPSLLPAQIGTPAGTPAFWWIALYN
ncbi:MAG: hypothetical protein ACRDVL_04785 [Acidimicrobiia bacterium]